MALDLRFGAAPLWIAALVLLAAVIGWETDWGRHVTLVQDTPPPKTSPVRVALLPDYALEGGPEARRDTVERPAFVPTRRPPPAPPAQEAAKPRLQRGQFVLTGTAVVDQQAIAFLRDASTGKSRTVRKGDTINGMTVTDIAPDRIQFALGDETEGLALKVAAGPRATIQPPQPGAPGTAGAPPGQPPGAAGQPPVAAAPGQPGAVPQVAQPDANAQSLLERRRAARAAQAAAEAAARANTPGAVPNTAPAQPQQAAPGGGDAGWAEVYRRMQQPRR